MFAQGPPAIHLLCEGMISHAADHSVLYSINHEECLQFLLQTVGYLYLKRIRKPRPASCPKDWGIYYCITLMTRKNSPELFSSCSMAESPAQRELSASVHWGTRRKAMQMRPGPFCLLHDLFDILIILK